MRVETIHIAFVFPSFCIQIAVRDLVALQAAIF
jgi:hypothetical protein